MTNSEIMAAASVVVAVLAFATAVWQTWVAHRHSRLSVRPILSWHTTKNRVGGALEIVVALSNTGVGPAIIRERYFQLDGVHYKPPAEKPAVEALAASLAPPDWECQVVSHGLPGEGTALPPGVSFQVARLTFGPSALQVPGELDRLMDRVRFVVVYEDLYENRSVFRT